LAKFHRPRGRLLGDDSILVLESWMRGSMHSALIVDDTGWCAGHSPRPRHKLMVAPKLGTSIAACSLVVAPRLGMLFATRVWTLGPSGLMVAPRLGTSFATRVWTFRPSRLMVAPRLGTLFATWVWTFGPSRL
jgi:hypothetical protein